MLEVILIRNHVRTKHVWAAGRSDPRERVGHHLGECVAPPEHDAAVEVAERLEGGWRHLGVDEAQRVHAIVLEKRGTIHR